MKLLISNNSFYQRRLRSYIFLALLLFVNIIPLTAAEYRITNEVFKIDGRSQEQVVLERIGSAVGKTFSTLTELESYRLSREQQLENLRAFKKSSVAADFDDTADAELIPVTLTYQIEDGTALFPIPIAFYNSNSGFQGGVLLTIPNINGTLQDALLMGLYIAPPDENDTLKWVNPNFFVLGTWSGIQLKPFSLSLAVSAKRMNEEVTVRGTDLAIFQNTGFSLAPGLTYQFTERLSTTSRVRFGFTPEYQVLEVTDPDKLAYGPLKYTVGFSQNLEYENFNWKGNFRDGIKGSATAAYTFAEPVFAESHGDFSVSAEAALYRAFADRFGPSVRLYGSANTGLPILTPAAALRGIRNSEFAGNQVLIANTTLQIKLFRMGSAELHLSPSLDWGIAHQRDSSETDSGFGTGAELLLILDTMKTFPIKLGFAYDLRDKYGDDLRSRIEVDFNFSFTY